ncbi:transglycosylase SLT domain-containing protein, partial [Flindersiella endophytica]
MAVSLAESRCNPLAVGQNGPTAGCPSGSRDRGLWQINDCYHAEVSESCAFDPQCNANAAYRISSQGTNWSPWSTFNSGSYRNWLDEAAAAVENLAGGGVGRVGSVVSAVSRGGRYDVFVRAADDRLL